MEIPSSKKKKIIVIVSNQNQVLLIKKNNQYHFPDSHVDWTIGKKIQTPNKTASILLADVTTGIMGDHKKIQKLFQLGIRQKMPTKGFCYSFEFEYLPQIVEINKQIRKYFDAPELCLRHIEEILKIESYENFSGNTIEACRTFLKK